MDSRLECLESEVAAGVDGISGNVSKEKGSPAECCLLGILEVEEANAILLNVVLAEDAGSFELLDGSVVDAGVGVEVAEETSAASLGRFHDRGE